MHKYLNLIALSIIQAIFINQQLWSNSNLDLEDLIQDFVLITKKIEIPESPYAFNPSFIRWDGRLLMSYREIPDNSSASTLSSSGESNIGLVWLNENFVPIGSPQILSLHDDNDIDNKMYLEDARLLIIQEKIFLVYSGNSTKILDNQGFRMFVAELEFDGTLFHVTHNECLSIFPGSNKNKREKNWVPFEYMGNLLLAYSVSPHKILRPLLDGSEKCESFSISYPSAIWEWGELRGGTPALPISDDLYLGFFHSSICLSTIHSNNMSVPHYFIGAYTFARKPPFEIRQLSPEPIVGKNFYHGARYQPYWHPVNVVFPCGLIYDENYIWISYGRQDHEIWVTKLDKQSLLDSLIPVYTIKK